MLNMDETGNNINFTVNENRPVIDNLKDSNNEILNRSAENTLSTVESASFFQSSKVTEVQDLPTANNYCQNVKPNNSFTMTDNFTCGLSDNSGETLTTNDSFNSLFQVHETASKTESSCNIPENMRKISGGSDDLLPDALSGEIRSDNLMNIRNRVLQCNESSISIVEGLDSVLIHGEELKVSESDVLQDLVDFSFKEQGNISVDLNENFTTDGSVPTHPETSPNTTPNETRLIAFANKQENVLVRISEKLPEADGVKVPNEPSFNKHSVSALEDSSRNSAVVIGDSINIDSSHALNVNDISKRKSDGEVSGFEPSSLDISTGCKTEDVNSKGIAINLSDIPSSVETHKFSLLKEEELSVFKPHEQFSDSDNTNNFFKSSDKKLDVSLEVDNILYKLSEKPLEKLSAVSVEVHENPFSEEQVSPLKVGNVSFGRSDKLHEQFFDSEINCQESKNHSSIEQDQVSPLTVGNVSFGMSDKPPKQFSEIDCKVPKILSSVEQDDVSPLKVGNISFGRCDENHEQFSDSKINCHKSKNHSNVEQDQISPLIVRNVSFGMSDMPPEQFSDIDCKVPKILSSVEQDDVSPLKLENVSFGMSGEPLEKFSDSKIDCKVSKNQSSVEQDQVSPLKVGNASFDISDKPLKKISDSEIDCKVPKNLSSVEQDQVSPLKLESVSFDMCDKTFDPFSDPKIAFKMFEDPLSNEINKVPTLKGENLSLDISAKLVEQFSDVDSACPLPENSIDQSEISSVHENVSFNCCDKPIQQCSDPDFPFKVPEVPLNNPLGQLRNPGFDFKVPEKSLTNEDDEQFVDASQFFKDPNSFQFLENIRTSTVQPGPVAPRSSLYVNFDPLHSKLQTNVPRLDNCELISAAVQGERIPAEILENHVSEAKNKLLVDVASRESIGNILISFDSPKSSASVDSKMPVETQSPKMFSEEELEQKLKIHYLETQEAYLKRQREMETEIAKRDELLRMQQLVIEEFSGISFKFAEDMKSCKEEVKSLKEENEKLKEDLKTSSEDVQNVENTFTDFYKRYDQCKGMLKTYKDNEEQLKKTILDLQDKANEQEEMYHVLQKRTEEMLEKANAEVDIAKRSGEAQVTVLKAQLKKAEMKISSLESDNKQIKMENSQLGGICDDLMAKVSQS